VHGRSFQEISGARMKIDFDILDRLVAEGTPAKGIVEFLRVQDARLAPKRTKEKLRQRAKRSNKQQHRATTSNTERQSATNSDIERQSATIGDISKTPSQVAERELYRLGRQVFGKNGGGLTTSLLKLHRYEFAVTRAVIETAATKADPREYVMGLLRKVAGNGAIDPTMAAFDRLISQTEGGEVERNPPMRDVTPRRA
jgi:hypothetical protein